MHAALLTLLVLQQSVEFQPEQPPGVRVRILLDASGSMNRFTPDVLMRRLKEWTTAHGGLPKCVDGVEVLTFKGDKTRGPRPECGMTADLQLNAGVRLSDGGMPARDWLDVSQVRDFGDGGGVDTPLGPALLKASQSPPHLARGAQSLLIVISDGYSDCGTGNLRGNSRKAARRIAEEAGFGELPRVLDAYSRVVLLKPAIRVKDDGWRSIDQPDAGRLDVALYPTEQGALESKVAQLVESMCQCQRRAWSSWVDRGRSGSLVPECGCMSEPVCPLDGGQFVCMSASGPPCECGDAFPEVVLVGNDRGFRCSGVIVGNQSVLTAAHCLPATRVGMGDHAETAEVVPVLASVAAPGEADLALLTTMQPVLRPGMNPPSLNTEEPQGPLVHVGFGTGAREFGQKHAVTLSARGWGCTAEASIETGCRPAVELYLPGSPGHDTCGGDSGGPVFQLERPLACTGVDGGITVRHRLVGLTSRSSAGAMVPCGQGAISSRVDVLAEWILLRSGAADGGRGP